MVFWCPHLASSCHSLGWWALMESWTCHSQNSSQSCRVPPESSFSGRHLWVSYFSVLPVYSSLFSDPLYLVDVPVEGVCIKQSFFVSIRKTEWQGGYYWRSLNFWFLDRKELYTFGKDHKAVWALHMRLTDEKWFCSKSVLTQIDGKFCLLNKIQIFTSFGIWCFPSTTFNNAFPMGRGEVFGGYMELQKEGWRVKLMFHEWSSVCDSKGSSHSFFSWGHHPNNSAFMVFIFIY